MKSTHKVTQEERIQVAKECLESGNNSDLHLLQFAPRFLLMLALAAAILQPGFACLPVFQLPCLAFSVLCMAFGKAQQERRREPNDCGKDGADSREMV